MVGGFVLKRVQRPDLPRVLPTDPPHEPAARPRARRDQLVADLLGEQAVRVERRQHADPDQRVGEAVAEVAHDRDGARERVLGQRALVDEERAESLLGQVRVDVLRVTLGDERFLDRAVLAVDGEQGVIRVLNILREEIEITMAKCGRPTVASIDSTVVVKAPRL